MTTSPSKTPWQDDAAGPLVDVAVVGGGPAGMSAAVAAAASGATVVVLDAGTTLGGQFWRHPPDGALAAEVAGQHHGLHHYRRLARSIATKARAGQLDVRQSHEVWTVEVAHGRSVVRAIDRSGPEPRERLVQARSLVLAPGAFDRQVPFPGWTLPGVMTAGGVQALLKGSATIAGQRVLVAGTGPFLLPVAAGLASAGATVVGVHEASRTSGWVRHPSAVIRNVTKLAEGAAYAATLARHRVPYRLRSTVLAAHGEDAVREVTVARLDAQGAVRNGTEERVPVDVLAVGWGFTPQLELPVAAGCATRLDVDGSLVVVVDDDQRSSVPGVFVAGEACGVGGAALAAAEGRIAGAAAARAVGRTSVGTGAARRGRSAMRAFARAMHLTYPMPSAWLTGVADDVLVCRCEEVPVARLRQVVDELGAQDARSAKLMARVGMGWCQGRVCGYAAACLVAHWTGTPPDPSQLASRPVATPVPLGALQVQDLADQPST